MVKNQFLHSLPYSHDNYMGTFDWFQKWPLEAIMRREGKKKRVFLVPAIRSSLFGMICYQDHLWRRNDDRLPCKKLLIYFETKRTFCNAISTGCQRQFFGVKEMAMSIRKTIKIQNVFHGLLCRLRTTQKPRKSHRISAATPLGNFMWRPL